MDSSMRAKCCCKKTAQSKTLLLVRQISMLPTTIILMFEYFDD